MAIASSGDGKVKVVLDRSGLMVNAGTSGIRLLIFQNFKLL